MKSIRVIGVGMLLAVLTMVVGDEPRVVAAIDLDEGCPQSSSPESQTGSALAAFADDTQGGVVYDDSAAALRLKKEGGVFSSRFFPATGNPHIICAGDFDEDGYADFVGADVSAQSLYFYKNESYENLPADPDWSDPSFALTPRFTRAHTAIWTNGTNNDGGGMMVSGDFNNDDHLDFIFITEQGNNGGRAALGMMVLGNGDGTFHTPYDVTSNVPYDFYDIEWDGNLWATDYNGDGWLDFLQGGWDDGGGYVRVFLNDRSSTHPTFSKGTRLVHDADMGSAGVSGIAYADFTGDSIDDLLISSQTSHHAKLYPGIGGGELSSSYQDIHVGGHNAQLLAVADFSLDGVLDFVTGDDGYSPLGGSGDAYYYKSNGTTHPFSDGVTQHISESFSDFDTGVVMDYDHDPDGTVDFLFADGNGAGFATFANRVVSTYVECGDVVSGTLALGDLENEEMVVTSARLDPDVTLPAGTSAAFYMSNEDPENWQEASTCIDDPESYCVSFPKPVGREVKWKARLCSDTSRTSTPTIQGVEIGFDYTPAEQHYRSGVVIHDGVAYVGAFRQPGERGHFYAVNAALDTTYWDAAAELDAMDDADRHVFTSTPDGTTRLDFTTDNAENLKETLSVATVAQAEDIVAWQRSARFGIGGAVPKTRLGSVETSTPAVLSTPGLPLWYSFATGTLKSKVDQFVEDHSTRPLLVLFGSRDGALHAIRTKPTDITDDLNGTEAWAFIPAKVAFSFAGDQADDVARSDYPDGTPIATSYPDGSPTLSDVVIDGEVRTVAVTASGNGGKSVFALDVTDTIDASGNVRSAESGGLAPLWNYVPGGDEAGRAYSKPSIARVELAGETRFIAIVGTGADPNVSSNGRYVAAVDAATGEELWTFETQCPLTSNILTFETDDDLEPGAVDIDGYIDRVVFADDCGNVYKVDPAQDTDGGTIAGIGDITETLPSGGTVNVLFSTAKTGLTSGTPALGERRPIAGTLAARPDSTTRMVLYFGTGGIESYDTSKVNEFYAVYADTGAIRDRVTGTCTDGRCEKFYGGVVVTDSQVIFTRAIDPPVGSSTCEVGSSSVDALDVDSFDDPDCAQCFSRTTNSASVSSLYGDRGAIYFATLSGNIVRIGTPAAANAGDDSAAGYQPGQIPDGVDEGQVGSGRPLTTLGWRQVL